MRCLTFCAGLLLSLALAAEQHVITVHANRFEPAVVNVQSGDTVQWQVTAGTHQISTLDNAQQVSITSPFLSPGDQYTATITGSGGEVYYASSLDPNMQGALVVAAPSNPFVIDQRINAGYHNPATSGQGLLFEYVPDSGVLIAYWFTFNQAGDAQQWFIATGPVNGHQATLTVLEPQGGQFNTASAIEQPQWGELTVVFDSCYRGRAYYNAAGEQHSGEFPFERLYLAAPCEQEATP
ncbi:cupredoxin domain-containing protein [Marinicella meishanensis]|uniref:cupredoxin domain-containing protein n=1 Tax=Marinicella meishanensis TaxID=2873263 RepID=UPI001CC125EE|nr:hypothetical protein [Marinicella sp. NBU2979]